MNALRARLGAARIRATADMAAVFAGRLGGVAVSLFFIPLYARLLTPAEFGVVALLLSLQAFFLVSDLGLATVLARDTAIAREDPAALLLVTENRRRAEIIMLASVLLVSAGALLAVGLAAGLAGEATAIRDMARIAGGTALIALLVLLNVAQLCLNALGHYQLAGVLTTTGTLARAAGSALVLALVSASVDAFIWSQLAIALLHYAVTRFALDRKSGSFPLNLARLADRAAFASLLARCKSVMVYTLAGAAALNLDKSILAAFLPIRVTGWYFLATTYALVPISLLSGPLSQYFSPRVAHAEAAGDEAARWRLGATYQLLLLAAVVVPAFILVRHAPLLIPLWLHDNPAVPQVIWLGSILLAGTAIGATGYYPTTYLIAVADNGFLARLSTILAVIALAAAAAWAAAGSLTGIAVSYAIFHALGCLALWWRLRVHWPRQAFWRFVSSCYAAPAAALLAACLVSWAIASALAAGWMAILVEVTLQLLLAGAAMAIISRWCYRRAASPPTLAAGKNKASRAPPVDHHPHA